MQFQTDVGRSPSNFYVVGGNFVWRWHWTAAAAAVCCIWRHGHFHIWNYLHLFTTNYWARNFPLLLWWANSFLRSQSISIVQFAVRCADSFFLIPFTFQYSIHLSQAEWFQFRSVVNCMPCHRIREVHESKWRYWAPIKNSFVSSVSSVPSPHFLNKFYKKKKNDFFSVS